MLRIITVIFWETLLDRNAVTRHCPVGTSPHYKFYVVQYICFISFLYNVVYSLYLFISLHKYNKSVLEILLVKHGTSPHYKFYVLQYICFIPFLYNVVHSLFLFISLHKYNKSVLVILLVKHQHLIHVEVWRLQIRTQKNGLSGPSVRI